MAEGRMLKRAVSDSKKLPELKTDAARLLWTWILPYLDVEGRYYADPDIIKGKVVPRIKTFTPQNVAEYLMDMDSVDLIILYEIEGEKYLQFRNFREFQNLRESKEAKSKIPPPPPRDREKSGTTPVPVQDKDGNTPLQFNIIKENLIKANRDELPDNKKPVDNSLSKEAFLKNYKELATTISTIFPSQYEQSQINLFVQSHMSNGNPGAIIHCLDSLIKAKKKETKAKPILSPKAYLENVFSKENGNYNEAEHTAKAAEYKKAGFSSMAELLAAIPKGET